MIEKKYQVTGMTCAACQANVMKTVSKLEGIQSVDVNLLSGDMKVSYEETIVDELKIAKAIQDIGYGMIISSNTSKDSFKGQWEARKQTSLDETKQMKKRLITSIILLIPLMYICMGPMMGLPSLPIFSGEENILLLALTQMLVTIVIVVINKHFFVSGFKALLHKVPNMDSLVAIGAGASLIYSIFAVYMIAYGFGHGDLELVHQYAHSLYFESAATILTLVTVGKYMETKSKAKTKDALERLMNLAPKMATVIRNNQEMVVLQEQVQVKDIVVIRPGEVIPVDGVIVEGYGYIDQAAITGESLPVEKRVGDVVISATTNKNGAFKFEAQKVGEDTTLAQIIRLVDEAGNTKAPIARMADKVSGVFVPIVISIAIVVTIVWLVLGYPFEFALTNAIAVLVISCPCALGLATPVAIMVATGKAAEFGILMKSAQALEQLHTVDTIVLDKTGTITSGKPQVTDILPYGISKKELLKFAYALENASEHPLGQAIVQRAKKDSIELLEFNEFMAVSGRGVCAKYQNETFFAGNLAYIQENDITVSTQVLEQMDMIASLGKTPLLFYRGNVYLGMIAVADTIKETSYQAIRKFKEMGLQVVMLTGDHKKTAEAIRKQLEIETVYAEVLPTEKDFVIQELQRQGKKVVMVGDGINDAPALVRADVGIAIGSGTDIAMDSADIVLMKNSLFDVVNAIHLSHQTMKNIHMNLFWAFFYNTLGIPVAAGVFYPLLRLNPMIGSLAMSMSSVCVVTNALRLRFVKEIKEEKGGKTMRTVVMSIEGMMCKHCVAHVEKALKSVMGVVEVVVSLEDNNATVTVEPHVSNDALKEVVEEADYKVLDIQ